MQKRYDSITMHWNYSSSAHNFENQIFCIKSVYMIDQGL